MFLPDLISLYLYWQIPIHLQLPLYSPLSCYEPTSAWRVSPQLPFVDRTRQLSHKISTLNRQSMPSNPLRILTSQEDTCFSQIFGPPKTSKWMTRCHFVCQRFILPDRCGHGAFGVPRRNSVYMYTMRCAIQRCSSGQVEDGSFGGTICGRPLLSDVSEDRGSVDYPASIAGRVWILFEHLLDSVFDAEEDSRRVDVLGALPDYLVNFPDGFEAALGF